MSSSLPGFIFENHVFLAVWIKLILKLMLLLQTFYLAGLFYKACHTRKSGPWVFADLGFQFDVKKTFFQNIHCKICQFSKLGAVVIAVVLVLSA